MIRHWLQPKRVIAKDGHVAGIEVEYTEMRDGTLTGTGETGVLAADQIFKAIGQTFETSDLGRWPLPEAASSSTPKAGRLFPTSGRAETV
ncbi:hypothetical protein DdX_22309 [Ditylenchus destructor]|uniref:Uncharacterized protein n=1 Tax=Ditylenchus destructor TaxID=166010 RepID=A0AAD4MF10_9BILA|nr:hypothetical protein DdX_22309 [Ditylenchus destructor]